ncbi:hypothetical protein WJX72_002094 [[Myrmecia] bisecta]|uniref:Uncharacterized protein n=1 Tax=[Myrmecia] bisecta TaxID=41462 RepID=A0AAW1QPI2_9CHLO
MPAVGSFTSAQHLPDSLHPARIRGGKSVIFAAVAQQAVEHDQHVNILIIAHRRELIFQARSHLARWGIQPGIIMAKQKADTSANVQVASIQTLVRRKLQRAPDLIIIDEAHHSRAKTYAQVIERYSEAQVLGCTATPYRLDGKGMRDMFDTLACGPSIASLIEKGHLVKLKVVEVGVSFQTFSKVPVAKGDYVNSKVEETLQASFTPQQVVAAFQQHASKRQAVVYATSVSHSQAIAKAFTKAGYKAVHVDGGTGDAARNGAIAELADRKIQLLVNCAIVSEGLDVPGINAVVLVRPTKAFGLYIQQVGRGLRPSQGKKDCLVLDCVGNVAYHGPPMQPLRFSLDMNVKEQTGAERKAEAAVAADEERALREQRTMEDRLKDFSLRAAQKHGDRQLLQPLQELFPWQTDAAVHAAWAKPDCWQLVDIGRPADQQRRAISPGCFLADMLYTSLIAVEHPPGSDTYAVGWAGMAGPVLDQPKFIHRIPLKDEPGLQFRAWPDAPVTSHPSHANMTLICAYTASPWAIHHLFKLGCWAGVKGNGRVGAIQSVAQLLRMLSAWTPDQVDPLIQQLREIQQARGYAPGWVYHQVKAFYGEIAAKRCMPFTKH